MLQKTKIINSFSKVNEDFIKRNTINIYRLAATIEHIEKRIYKKVA